MTAPFGEPHSEGEFRVALDDDHVLEPMSSPPESLLTPAGPVISDVHGRAWRIRRRSPWPSTATWCVCAAAILALVIIAGWVLIL